jgi:Nif-specific regulatory protein
MITVAGSAVEDQGPTEHDGRDLEVLANVARLLATLSGQRQILTSVLDELERELGMIRGTIMLLSSDGNELFVEVAQDVPGDEGKDIRYSRGEGIVGTVLETGQAAIVPRISAEPRFVNRIHRRDDDQGGEGSFLCVPITLGSEVVGTLSVDLPSLEAEQLMQRARVLSIVASMIAFDVKSRRTEALHQQRLEAENLRLRNALEERFRPENIIGNSHAMRSVYLQIHQVAPADTTVLVRGESGTGKELVASAIHYSSPRGKKPFVKVNCAALSEGLLESELFGHEKGAFTGALYQRIEEAEGGTLFLDEIGDFSPSVQVKLLRVLQSHEFQRVGSNKTFLGNVRVIAATNQDLEQRMEAGLFRHDLYLPLGGHRLLLMDHSLDISAEICQKSLVEGSGGTNSQGWRDVECFARRRAANSRPTWLHAGRVAGGDYDHRHDHGPLASGRQPRPRDGAERALHQQPRATRQGDQPVSRYPRIPSLRNLAAADLGRAVALADVREPSVAPGLWIDAHFSAPVPGCADGLQPNQLDVRDTCRHRHCALDSGRRHHHRAIASGRRDQHHLDQVGV